MERPRQSYEAFDFSALVLLSIAFFALVATAYWREMRSDWEPLQKDFQSILAQNGQADAARRFRPGIRQIWIPELGVVDRCPTCHLGYEWGSLLPADLPHPFKPHPPLTYMQQHPFETYGCTVCHGGQGWATETQTAHGGGSHWTEPLLSTELAGQYGLSRGQLMEMRCNACHRRDTSTPGMTEIDKAKKLVKKKKCLVCHVIAGRGGLKAPELTYYGDKNPELVDFSHVDGPPTLFNWNLQHLTNAEAVSPTTSMPTYRFEPPQARALALLLLSWKRQTFPPQYIPPPPDSREPVRSLAKITEPPLIAGAEAGREIFVTRGCNHCHTVGAGALLGPDLRGVAGRRAEDWLRTWVADPAAMIRAHPELVGWPEEYDGIVMPNQNLTAAEIDAVVDYLLHL